MRILATRMWCAIIATLLCTISCASARADFEFADADLFFVQYADGSGSTLRVGIADATAFELLPWPNGVLGKWTVPVLGRRADVYVGFGVIDGRTTRWTIGVVHNAPLPSGWRLEHVDRRFGLQQMVAGAASQDVLRIAKVFGPTALPATASWDERLLFPNFLQTQQATLTNPVDGKATSLVIDDHGGHRKYVGFRSDPRSGLRELWVRSVPENPATPLVFVPSYDVLLRSDLDGLDGALDWYRSTQKADPQSFLSKRISTPPHTLLASNKFMVAPGAVTTSIQVGPRYDITSGYRSALINDFGNVHGAGMIVYHLGWQNSTSTLTQCVWPDVAQGIMPGHQLLINQMRAQGHYNIPYFLPVWTNIQSAFYDATQVRSSITGALDVRTYPPCNGIFGLYSWSAPQIGPLYDNIIVNTMVRQFGFDGVYLDALSASDFSYTAAHNPPADANEQLVGINQWLAGARARASQFRQTPLLIANETPTEVFDTDISALDLGEGGGAGLNLHRRTYAGSEWPTVGVVEGQHPIIYSYRMARVLATGVRPLVVWPEWDGQFPVSALASDEFDAFHDLLQLYSYRFTVGFDEAIDGFLLAPLRTYRATSVPPVPQLAPCPRRWTQPVPAVVHGVFKPTETSDRRVIVLARWTDPDSDVIGDLNLPLTHPLWNVNETVQFDLSKSELRVDPTRVYSVYVYDTLRRQTRFLGRLPTSSTAALTVNETIDRGNVFVVFVIPD